ncbi:RHS repeat-associated core domain-containing protein [Gryllotalpicola protaetiae]|uniref:RHS repeat-associated core domain-containing protein n=1 Tax=Gryllotalpicola protaetiae TaxID=2419771 RepID=UPI0013C462EA|nr:RHS repeat-associated core domain-containing protein [Gryllotalpicola protaetiae]
MAAYRYPAAGAPHPHAVAQIAATGATTSTQPYSYSWDAAGDATQLGALTASYDSQGKTATITSGTSTQTRVYDAGGSLLLQIDPTGSTLFLGDTEVRLAAGAASASASRTYSVEGVPFAERDAAAGATTSSLYWLGVDVDGSPDVEVNSATGQVTKRFTDPFGNTRGTGVSWSSDRGFLNDSSSALSGLTQVGARLYDSATGSFTTADPLLDATSFASLNAYAYAGNDPVTDTDPSGECLQSNGALTQATNCGTSKGSATAASATMIADQKQAAYEATPLGQIYLWGLTVASSKAFKDAMAKAWQQDNYGLGASAKPGEESLGDELDLMSANTQMQMLWMNSAAEAAPEDGAAEDLGAEFESFFGDVFAGKNAADARGGVYTLRDGDGNVVRTGRTKDFVARQGQHAQDPILRQFDFNEEFYTDDYAEQRGLEDWLYQRYPEARAANGGFNKIGAVSPSNPNLAAYQQAASSYLERFK